VAAKAAPAPAPAKPAVPASGKGAAIAAAALGQIGVGQDCTRLATNSLAAVGINFHGWPAGYLSLGQTVSAAEARPGDLAYYQNGGMGLAHIAVYVGNGQAVHGGWNGGTTALFSVNVGSGPVFIRVA
jgi:cell wall-associated NlpC family hydrolase